MGLGEKLELFLYHFFLNTCWESLWYIELFQSKVFHKVTYIINLVITIQTIFWKQRQEHFLFSFKKHNFSATLEVFLRRWEIGVDAGGESWLFCSLRISTCFQPLKPIQSSWMLERKEGSPANAKPVYSSLYKKVYLVSVRVLSESAQNRRAKSKKHHVAKFKKTIACDL